MEDKDESLNWTSEKLDKMLKQLDELNKKIEVESATPEDVLGTNENILRFPVDQPDFTEQLKKELDNAVKYKKATEEWKSELLKKLDYLKERCLKNRKKDVMVDKFRYLGD